MTKLNLKYFNDRELRDGPLAPTAKYQRAIERMVKVMTKFLKEIRKNKFSYSLNELIPTITDLLCPNCPLHLYRLRSCTVQKGKLALELIAKSLDNDYNLLEAVPFARLNKVGDELCIMQNEDKKFILWDKITGCIKYPNSSTIDHQLKTIWAPVTKTCEKTNPVTFKQSTCLRDKSVPSELSKQIIETDKERYVYCHNEELSVENQTIDCEDSIVRLPKET